ncbi:MAG: hypothetical protein ACI84C_001491 [Flavobacteriales bacterium]|jgi:hypothetical protein
MEEIIIYRALYYADIVGVKLLLDNHSIWYRVQDEDSSVVMSWSASIGGIKVYVRREDFLKSTGLLQENGFINEKEDIQEMYPEGVGEPEESSAFLKFLVNHSKWVLVSVIAIVILLFTVEYVNAPSDSEVLSSGEWCIEAFHASDRQHMERIKIEMESLLGVDRKQLEFFISLRGNWCSDRITFSNDGEFLFEIWTLEVKGKWTFEDNLITLKGNDGMATFLNASLNLDFQQGKFILHNDSLVIHGSRQSLLNSPHISVE